MTESGESRIPWRLLIDAEPGSGAWNMAVDEFLFQSLSEKTPQTIVRFYSWGRTTASLGVSQKSDSVMDVQACEQKGIDIVRRMTGGKLVLHADELTYCVCSSDTSVFTSGLDGAYRSISEALVCGLEQMGLSPHMANRTSEGYARSHLPCFSKLAKNEIEVKGKKIVGSAQKRMGNRFIQHGSLPLSNHLSLLMSIAFQPDSSLEFQIISLSEALGREISFAWAVDRLILGFKEFFKIDFKESRLDREEKRKIKQIENQKYSSPSWTFNP